MKKWSSVSARSSTCQSQTVSPTRDFQLRHQPVAQQAPGLPRCLPRAQGGGRLAISDVVATVELPEEMRNDAGLISGCMGNASLIVDLDEMMRAAGFEQIRIQPKDESKEFINDWAPGQNVTDFVVSATIETVKPGACCGGCSC